MFSLSGNSICILYYSGALKLSAQPCAPDRDIAPEGSTLEESNRNLDEITDLALKLQNQTGVKLLWITCNLFTHLRLTL